MHERGRETKPTLDARDLCEGARRFWIEAQDESDGRIVPLSKSRLVIGSSKRADVVLEDPTVSAEHCVLSVGDDGVLVEDKGSRNGTFVGGARVEQALCRGGAVMNVGRSTVAFHEARAEDDDAEELADVRPLVGVAGASLAMRRVARDVRNLAKHIEPVLVTGETGTGKELVARALHDEGPRAERPFVPLNVAALPRELVESELFGHERGAFTGAVARRCGAFEEASTGTLFLDEIGELPIDAQPKLLRALDGYEVRSVGGSGGGRRFDVRLVAATHVAIAERVDQGLFRRDLFHRLEVFVVEIPPLRERRSDIGAIASRVLARLAASDGDAKRTLTAAALARLVAHDWPGNVRELRNVLIRAAHLSRTPATLSAYDVEQGLRARVAALPTLSPGLARALLREHNGNMSAAARAAGVPRTSFRKLVV